MKKYLKPFFESSGMLPVLQALRDRLFPDKRVTESEVDLNRYIKFYGSLINKNDLCYDIGAHRGHRTHVFSKLGARVVAFEPQKNLCTYIKYRYSGNIIVRNVGLGSKEEIGEFYESDASSLSTFSKEWLAKAKERFSNANWVKKGSIEIKTLDSMIETYGLPQFCKIDVEGFEFEVLKGLSQPVNIISFEFMIPENTIIVQQCLKYLHELSNKGILINYCLGDSLHFELDEWVPYNEAIIYFNSALFNGASWGDIYVKMI